MAPSEQKEESCTEYIFNWLTGRQRDNILAPEEFEKNTKLIQEKYKSKLVMDPRFQQVNQTLRCYVMYTDFFRCEKILGEGNQACTWFKDIYKSICPNSWIEHWDRQRTQDPPTFPWHKQEQGHFPGHSYGK